MFIMCIISVFVFKFSIIVPDNHQLLFAYLPHPWLTTIGDEGIYGMQKSSLIYKSLKVQLLFSQ